MIAPFNSSLLCDIVIPLSCAPETPKIHEDDNFSELHDHISSNIDLDSNDWSIFIDESRPRITDFHPDSFPLFQSPPHTDHVSSLEDVDWKAFPMLFFQYTVTLQYNSY